MSLAFSTLITQTWLSATLVIGLGMLGCAAPHTSDESDEAPPDYSKVVPVTGTVKLNGKPLATAVVTFLPPKWSASNGETDENGKYVLETAGKPGSLPGEYKVCISYLVSAEGEPQGLEPRSSIAPSPGMITAREKLPPAYSDFGRTTFKRTVPAEGGTFDFDLPVDLSKPATEPIKAESR